MRKIPQTLYCYWVTSVSQCLHAGFYTGWLLPASVVGTVIFLIGFWLVATDIPA